MRVTSCVLALALACHAVPGAEFLAPQDTTADRTSTAAAYGLKPGMNALLVGWYPVRHFLDWSDPPMDCVSDTVAVAGCQFGRGNEQVDLRSTFDGARFLPRAGNVKYAYAAWRADW